MRRWYEFRRLETTLASPRLARRQGSRSLLKGVGGHVHSVRYLLRMTSNRTVVTFESGAFNTTHPRAYFINQCCYGDDVARWLISELDARGCEVDHEPEQEDFG